MSKELVKLCIDTARGNVSNYSVKEGNEVIRQAFVDLMGTSTPSYRQFRENKNAIFAIIEETLEVLVNEGLENNPFFQEFVEYKDVAFGDKNEFYVEDQSVLVVSEVARGTNSLRRQKLDIGDSFSVKTRPMAVKIYADLHRVLAGRLDWVDFVRKVEEAFKIQMAEEMYTKFMNAGTYLPPAFTHTGSFSEDEMERIIQNVQASNNATPVIAGTRNALRQIIGSYSGGNSFLVSDKMKDEINTRGVIQTWNGVPLLEIPQIFKRNTFDFAIDDKKLLVLPANTKPVKVVREGEPIIIEEGTGTVNKDMSLEYSLIMEYGVDIIFGSLFGSYTLS